MAWTADELYGNNPGLLNGLDACNEAFVVEIPSDLRVWMIKPEVLKNPPENDQTEGRPKTYPRLKRTQRAPSKVRNLSQYSPAFRKQAWQRYRIKDTHHGSEVWEIRWATCYRQTHDKGIVSNQCTLVVARNVITGEVKYFLSNRVPGRNGWTLRMVLRVAFGRWPIEDCFREAKEELGFDHFECRSWHGIHRHLFLAILTQLFCARVRQELSPSEDVESGELLTTEQVRRAVSVVVSAMTLPPRVQRQLYQDEAERQAYYARRNARAARSHRKTRRRKLKELGIDPDKIKSLKHPKSQ
jgi:SRSO17 transposase